MSNKKNTKPPLIIIAGPTATGKTKTAVELAESVNGEIISADSMQVYKYMDIGTAKPTTDEMRGIPHYLIDELDPAIDFSVAMFQSMAKKYLAEIYAKKKIPILVGGTGFYINALLYDNSFTETNINPRYREELFQLAEEKGNGYLHHMLKAVDPDAANAIHSNNTKRVVRALEFFRETGMKISEHNRLEKQKEPFYNAAFFVLNMYRPKLYERIDRRVDKMLDDGLVGEVENLVAMGYGKKNVSMQGLGYKEMISYLNGEITLEEAVYTVKRETRRFAKRQVTWFKNQCNPVWINVDEFVKSCIMETILYYLTENDIMGSCFE